MKEYFAVIAIYSNAQLEVILTLRLLIAIPLTPKHISNHLECIQKRLRELPGNQFTNDKSEVCTVEVASVVKGENDIQIIRYFLF